MNRTKSIIKYCLECMDGQKKEVEACPSIECPLHKIRLGQTGGRKSECIKAKCKDCTEDNRLAVGKCEFKGCPLYTYRLR